MKYAAVAALAAVLFAAVGCSTPVETAPETDAPAFDPERYLTASGVGASEAEARRDALAEIKEIFE